MNDSHLAGKVAARFVAASEVVLAEKSTGDYRLKLVDNPREETMTLKVMYTGDWGGGPWADIWLEPEEDYEPEDVVKWFKNDIRGDRYVMELLLKAGYDEHTNPSGRHEPVTIRL